VLRDPAAWAAGPGCSSCTPKNRPPPPAPRLVTLAKRPSLGAGWFRNIIPRNKVNNARCAILPRPVARLERKRHAGKTRRARLSLTLNPGYACYRGRTKVGDVASFARLYLVGIIVVGIAGYQHWDWPYSVGVAVLTFIAYQAGTRFQAVHLTAQAGIGFLWRHLVMSAILFGVIWLIGYGVALLIGR